jgi:uncharacterized protein YndB with AHSA1/START domain
MSEDEAPDEIRQAVIVECDLEEPPEKVWRALTVPELVAAWLMPNDIRPEIGRRFTFNREGATGGNIACEVLAAEPNRLIRYSWRGEEAERNGEDRPSDTVVTFVLTETETGGTHLRLVHSGFPRSLRRPVPRLAAKRPTVSSMLAMPDRRRRLPRAIFGIATPTARRSLKWAA